MRQAGLRKGGRGAVTAAAQISPDIESSTRLAICLLATKDPKDKERAAAGFPADDGDGRRQLVRCMSCLAVPIAMRTTCLMPIREFQRAIQLDPRRRTPITFSALRASL